MMGTVARIAAVVLAISFMTFVAFFGRLPALRNTPIAWLHRAIWVHLPNAVLAVDRKLTGGRFTESLVRFGRFMMHDRHPTVMIFFFVLLAASEAVALPYAWPQLTTAQQATTVVTVALPYLFLYLCAAVDPGYVTAETHRRHMSAYPYDFTLFHPGQACRTCGLLKPPRSKHCSVCKRCVARMDHHCIFINGCVGAGNVHWFLLLLLSTAVLTLWGGTLALSLVARRIRGRVPDFSLLWWRSGGGSGGGTGGMDLATYFVLWAWAIQQQVELGAVGLLATLCSPLVWGLLAYNLWNVWCGVTTNESLKWSDLGEDMADGLAFKRPVPPGRLRDLRFEAAWTPWPVEPQQVVIRSGDGNPPPVEGGGFPGRGEWEQVWKLKDVENLYDLGFWDNLRDVFGPARTDHERDVIVPARDEGRAKRRRVR
ncbi:hypothetical protein RB598_006492 [Gaeumannomyces tritici]